MEVDPTIAIKCPYCDEVRNISELKLAVLELITSDTGVSATSTRTTRTTRPRWTSYPRIFFELLKEAGAASAKRKAASSNNALNEANAWIDMKCPHCGKTYQYNTRLRETRQ